MTGRNDDNLDDLFAQARKQAPKVDDALVGRVLADADATQAGFAGRMDAAPRARGIRSWVRDMIGGWPAAGGLALATGAGVWFGMAPPAPVADVTALLVGETITVALVPGDLGLQTGDPIDG